VGTKEPLGFNFPIIQNLYPKLRNILENNVADKYTLSDHLWKYLQDYAEKHRLKGNGFGYGLTDVDGISRTLSARYYKDGSEILIPQLQKNPRRLTPRECARLMGFPDTYQIVCSDTRAYKQFGNTVVVPIVRIIAQEIVKCLVMNIKSNQDNLSHTASLDKLGKYYLSDENKFAIYSASKATL
jgi:DNA (cytosine-5)-methyltransferase 1